MKTFFKIILQAFFHLIQLLVLFACFTGLFYLFFVTGWGLLILLIITAIYCAYKDLENSGKL